MSDQPIGESDLAAARPGRAEFVGALTLAAFTIATFVVAAPLARRPLLRVEPFIPTYESALALADLIAAVLLFAHFHRARAWAVLILACGYLFNALLIVPHFLTFPGVFSPEGLLGAGPQTTAWLYCFWHGGFAALVLAFAWLRRRAPTARASRGGAAILGAVLGVVALAAMLVILSTAGERFLPVVVENGDYAMLVAKGVSPAMCGLCVVSLWLLAPRLRAGVLDLWLFVVMLAWLCDVLLGSVVGSNRFDLGWYAGRSYSLIATVVLLVLLLMEFSNLDVKLEARTAELRASRALMQTFFEYSSECFAILTPAEAGEFRYEEINAATLALYGKTRAEVVGHTTGEALGPDPAADVNAFLAAALCSRAPQRYERLQGERVIEALATPVPETPSQPPRVIVSARDITERRKLEDQLRQSQKMEAIGQLTGGIAHDFNNMLAIVMGSLDIARRRLAKAPEDGVRKWIENAADGAQRAATLTSRLLSFARRQALEPKLTDLNQLVAATSQLLRQTIPESVEIETVLAGGLWRVSVDQTQVENALVNLAVNARDAMPNGGRITIETRNADLDDRYARRHSDVKAGQYVMVSVTDTGAGMSQEVVERAFEPFFSTKAPGKGTGLGLSQVFGFVKQSHGHVKIYSELGRGTTVKIYLPRPPASELAVETRTVPRALRGLKGEFVLVVEDEGAVREMSLEALKDLGCAALAAESPGHALNLLAENPDIVLLFTDVVMPGMTGRELADRARALRPELKVLYTTGYSRNAIVHNGVLDAGAHLLAKPFTVEELAAKLAQALAG